jgi:hypothetical protein
MSDAPEMTVQSFRAAIAAERAADRKAADNMVRACKSGDADRFCEAVDMIHDYSVDGWRLAFKKISKLTDVSPAIQRAFLQVWVESKSIRLSIGDDLLVIAGLRVLLPNYQGPPEVLLFRGDSLRARHRRIYGMSWTDNIEIAERFASTGLCRGSEGGSVLLETLAPAAAIISTTQSIGDHYNEREFLVDRRRLGRVKVVRRFPALKG